MSLYYQIPGYAKQRINRDSIATIDLKTVNSGVIATTPKVTLDTRRVYAGKVFAADTKHLVAIRMNTIFGSSRALYSASAYPEYMMDINYKETRRTTRTTSAIRSGYYNLFTGKFMAGFPQTTNDSFGDDIAARSSYDVPGSLTFRVGNKITSQHYEAKG